MYSIYRSIKCAKFNGLMSVKESSKIEFIKIDLRDGASHRFYALVGKWS